MKRSIKFIAKEFNKSFEEVSNLLSDVAPDGRSKSDYEVPTYSEETVTKAAYDKGELDYFDWYCDKCGAFLNHQFGFVNHGDTWKCECCGYENSISKDDIIL